MKLGGYELLRPLSSGPDGTAYVARSGGGSSEVELRHLGVARRDPRRWHELQARLGLVRGMFAEGMRRVLAIELHAAEPHVVLAAADGTLAERLEAGSLEPAAADALVAGVAKALALAHRVGLVHGSIGPARVFLDAGGAASLDLSGTHTGDTVAPGALDRSCIPPEARAGLQVTPSGDVYALGALWRCALTGGPAAGTGSDDDTEHASGNSVAGDVEPPLLGEMCDADPEVRPRAWEVARALGARADAAEETISAGGSTALDRPTRRPRPTTGETLPESLGRYRLVERLGRGAMGSVYRAEDIGGAGPAALKVLHPGSVAEPKILHRFMREARLLSELHNPHIARFIEVNEDRGIPYLAMELVEGRNLSRELRSREQFDEDEALAIASDVARALADVHALGVVHRDVKPANIILAAGSGAGTVKLCDFGLARRLAESAGNSLTLSGATLGTPRYMSPEQCQGLEVDGRADVYSLGATLFRMLAGRPPFVGESSGAVIAMHIRDPAPDVGAFRPDIRPSLAALVTRMLEKDPGDRPANGAAALDELERVRRGEVAGIEAHPYRPVASDAGPVASYAVELDLQASPVALWPYVSDTERLNRAIGLQAVAWRRQAGEPGIETYGSMQAVGMQVRWREHPYEWVAPERLGVLREYSEGPFRWLRSSVQLWRREEGGTRLRHLVEIAPRGFMGRTAGRVEVGFRVRRALVRVYERMDRVVRMRSSHERGEGGALPDPFEDPPELSHAARERLARIHARMLERGADEVVIDRVLGYLERATPQAAGRIRPRALAREQGLNERDVIEACLLATHEGALVLRWDVLCPSCRIPSSTLGTLADLRGHAECEACDLDFELDLARSVELVFYAHPQVREVEQGLYCIGGPGHFPHVIAQVRLAPGERFELNLSLDEGRYQITGRQLPATWRFRVARGAMLSSWDVELRAAGSPVVDRALRPTRQRIVLASGLDAEVTVRVERAPGREDALTAAEAACLPLFRRLFASEILAPGQLISVSRVILLLARIDDVDALYAGDEMESYAAVARLHREVDECVTAEAGAVVKIHGDGILASFADPVAATRAALALARERPDVRVAVHAGTAMATTINERLDYFGRTVHRVGEIVAAAGGPGLVLGEEIASDPATQAVLGRVAAKARVIGTAGVFARRLALQPVV